MKMWGQSGDQLGAMIETERQQMSLLLEHIRYTWRHSQAGQLTFVRNWQNGMDRIQNASLMKQKCD
jgi:hypothetical protein